MFVQLRNFPSHMVDSSGNIYRFLKASKKKEARWVKLDPYVGEGGYRAVLLCKGGKQYLRRVHRLIAEAFLGPGNTGEVVNHINGDKLDNRVENLEYITQKQNCRHASEKGLIQQRKRPPGGGKGMRGANNMFAKLSEEEAIQILSLRGKFTVKVAAEKFGVSGNIVARLWRGHTWKHLHFEL